ncbi:Protein mms22 [Mycena venus]|uniref:Protein mms22 n=1 Tax=Mycena venus TaxID=2733690 RepID=A0A8H6Y9F5_9AGAR|nr:Protein mms22 [Mycena venus]
MDEIVETSDPEELEELARFKSPIRPSSRDGRQSPRKRPKLHHDYSDIALRTPARSISSSSHEPPSPRYRSKSEYTSPISLHRASSSPVATPPISVADPSVSPHVAEPTEEPLSVCNTQGPLLLGGTVSPKLRVALQDAGSRSSSPRLDHSEPGSPMMDAQPGHSSTPSRSQRARSESVDPLLLFTPSRPSINDEDVGVPPAVDDDLRASSSQPFNSPPSPLTPPPPERPDSPVPLRRSTSPPTHPDDEAIALALANNLGVPRRYSLRDRQPQQIKPYQFDKVLYQNTMRHLPEAIVKIRSPRRQTREENYEQTQEPQGDDSNENDNWEQHRRRRSKTKSPPPPKPPQWITDAVPALPSSDEEDGVDATRKEARRVLREQKKREANGKTGRKTAKPFPLKPTDGSNKRSRASRKSPSCRPADPDSPAARVSQEPSSHCPRRGTSGSSTSPASGPRPLTPVFQNARSVSPPTFYRNDSDVDMEMPGNFSPSHSPHVQRSHRGTPIVITDDESDRASDPTLQTPEESEPEQLTKEEKKQRRRIRALNRMYPAFMRERMMKDAASVKAATRRQRSATVSSESEEEQPLLPGQTRVRRAENPRDVRDIKGDTESSDDQMVGTRDAVDSSGGTVASDSDVEVVWPRRKGRAREEDIWRSSDEEVLSDSRIDDERIEAYLGEAPLRGSGLQEKDMIDWMLDNTAQVGGARRPRTRAKRTQKLLRPKAQSDPKYRSKSVELSVSVRCYYRSTNRRNAADPGNDDEPILPHWRNPPRRDRHSYSSPERQDAPSFRDDDELPPSPPPARNAVTGIVHHIPDPEMLRKAARKQKEKERRARMKKNGIYTFVAPKGTHIDGQRGKVLSKAVAIVADRGFHRALAPKKSGKAAQPLRPPTSKIGHVQIKSAPRTSGVGVRRRLLPRGDRSHTFVSEDDEPDGDGPECDEETGVQTRQEETEDDAHPPDPYVKEQPFLLDFGIPVFPRTTFSFAQTYTGKGGLKELVDPSPDAVRRTYFSAQGFDLNPNLSTREFLDILSNICDRFFEFVTGLPEADNGEQANEWSGLTSVACELVAILPPSEELKAAVETQVFRLTSKMREASLTSTSMDSTTFAICWFTVELAIRAGFRLPTNAPRPKDPLNALYEACAVLVEHLLEYGLERGMEPLVDESVIDGSTMAHWAFEMWIRLWHIGHRYRDTTSTAVHPLWKLVQTTLHGRQSPELSPLDASEQVWRAIISLSTVSQFSVMGRCERSTIVSPTCWDMVIFAFQQIGFEANDELDKTMSDATLDNRDRYIRLVVERCCLLWSRWKWGLDDTSTSPALSQLIKIFQSRKFANLRHEKPEFPDFLRVNDWTLLSQHIHSEITFVLLLKLVYQTLLVTPSKSKKLLSLLTPVGHLPWSKSQPPSLHDLSQLFNRFSAFAIAIHFDPDGHVQWIQRARGYVQFKDVDATTRNAYIRGLMYLSIVMVERNVQLDESLSWLNEMVTGLLDEHKRQTDKRQTESTVVLAIHLLVVSVRNVIHTFMTSTPQRYPDPRLLLSLERILRDASLVKPTNASAHMVPRLIQSFLTARALAVPEPRRPVIPDQESQDEYGALGLDDDMMAALVEEDLPEYQTKDRTLCKLLDENIIWTIFRQLVQYVKAEKLKKSFKDNDRLSTDIVSLTECWLGCGQIVIQNSQKSWPIFLHAYGGRNSNWPILDHFCQRRMDFLVFSNVLKLEPMSYLTPLQDSFLVVLFESFASWHTTSEDDYIKLLLSIDGQQHPLLEGVSWDPDVLNDTASNIDPLTARLPLLRAILGNLNNCLTESGRPAEDNEKYVGYCIKMFSAMKNVHLELAKSKTAQRSYTSWCSEVYRECLNRQDIAGEDRLQQWMAWGERLNHDNVQN